MAQRGGHLAKSGQLAEALAGGKKIVVCTIQTFPFALKAVQDLAATSGKRFAVIADEAAAAQLEHAEYYRFAWENHFNVG